jgi:hypothetical protein
LALPGKENKLFEKREFEGLGKLDALLGVRNDDDYADKDLNGLEDSDLLVYLILKEWRESFVPPGPIADNLLSGSFCYLGVFEKSDAGVVLAKSPTAGCYSTYLTGFVKNVAVGLEKRLAAGLDSIYLAVFEKSPAEVVFEKSPAEVVFEKSDAEVELVKSDGDAEFVKSPAGFGSVYFCYFGGSAFVFEKSSKVGLVSAYFG